MADKSERITAIERSIENLRKAYNSIKSDLALVERRRKKVRENGTAKKVSPRLRECCRQSQAELESNNRNKIHLTWGLGFAF